MVKLVNPVQPLKIYPAKELACFIMFVAISFVIDTQFSKAYRNIAKLASSATEIFDNLEQLLKQYSPIEVTELGIEKFDKLVHP